MEKKLIKKTPGRTVILEYLEKQKKPVSVDDIYKAVQKYAINQSTVYRTINLFITEGVVRPVIISKDKLYIEIVRENDHHHHLICTICQKIEDFDLCEITDISKKVLKKHPLFQTITKHSFELFGICKPCSKK